MLEFTIGFLGHFQHSPRMREYLDTIISRYTCDGVQLRIVFDLSSKHHIQLAERVLSIKRICPNLHLLPVITDRQEITYRRRSESPTAQQRKRILDATDGYETICGNVGEYMRMLSLNRVYAGRCDLILYSGFHVPLPVSNNLRHLICSTDNPPSVLNIFDEYPLRHPVSFDPDLELADSIDYIRRSNFRIMSDTLPSELLEKWLNASGEPPCYKRLAALDDIADVFRLSNGPCQNLLLYKVFAYAYALHRDMWVLQRGSDSGEAVSVLYRKFRRLLELVAEARKAGIDVGRHNLLDFDDYDNLLVKCSWFRRLDELTERLI